MQIYKQHKTQIISLFVAVLIFMLLMSVSFWNHSLRSNIQLGVFPFLFFILAIAALIVVYSQVLKITDPQKINATIQQQVDNERSKILASLETKEDDVKETKVNIDLKIKDIIPRGSYKSTDGFLEKLLKNLTSEIQASLGIIYLAVKNGDQFNCSSKFAIPGDTVPESFKPGENLNGEVARTKEIMILDDVPEDYFTIESGLGMARPKTLIIAPLVHNKKCIALLELATFKKSNEDTQQLIEEVCKQAAEKLNNLQKS